jgi:hypothetical protein
MSTGKRDCLSHISKTTIALPLHTPPSAISTTKRAFKQTFAHDSNFLKRPSQTSNAVLTPLRPPATM